MRRQASAGGGKNRRSVGGGSMARGRLGSGLFPRGQQGRREVDDGGRKAVGADEALVWRGVFHGVDDKARVLGRGDAVRAVFDGDAAGGADAEGVCGEEIGVGMRLGSRGVFAGDDGMEEVSEAEGSEGGIDFEAHGGGAEGEGRAEGSEGVEEGDDAGVGRDAAGAEGGEEGAVLGGEEMGEEGVGERDVLLGEGVAEGVGVGPTDEAWAVEGDIVR